MGLEVCLQIMQAINMVIREIKAGAMLLDHLMLIRQEPIEILLRLMGVSQMDSQIYSQLGKISNNQIVPIKIE